MIRNPKKKMLLAGVDVSAAELVVAIRLLNGKLKELTLPNTLEGHKKLCSLLTKKGRWTRVIVEATSNYHLDLVLVLDAVAQIEVMVVNPLSARRFAQAQMRRAKTDKVDARSLLAFLESMPFVAWQRPSDAHIQLRMLGRHISTLIKSRVAVVNRQEALAATKVAPAFLVQELEQQRTDLLQRIKATEDEAVRLIQTSSALTAKFEALCSMPGIAARSAVRLLAEFVLLADDLSPDELVAHAGLDPRPKQSGRSDPARSISKRGNARIRGALFMPAMAAVRQNPAVREWYDKLLARGKLKMVALTAVMRRLLRIAWVIYLRESCWEDARFRPKATTRQDVAAR